MDVVGHIEDKGAIIKAVEVVDRQVGRICQKALENDVTVILTADHGTVERWDHPDGKIDTGHTNSPVPFILVDKRCKNKNVLLRADGELTDIAPTLLDLIGLNKPEGMTGYTLLKSDNKIHIKNNRVLLLILDGWGIGSGSR